jgi:hypothetical protein
MNYVERETCRMDGGKLETVLDFGSLYPSNFVGKDNSRVKVPLVLCKGSTSDLVQLKHTMDRDILYRNYWYRSDLNLSMVIALNDVVLRLKSKTTVFDDDVVVDIGANDGTLLSMFPSYATTVGFDPANNLEEVASTRCTYFINDYFTADKYPLKKKAKVVTSIAMFYDLEEPNTFIQDVKEILAPNGIWVIQLTDLLSMMKINAFDNIVHEHLEYYSLDVLATLMDMNGLHLFDVSYNNVNGRSIRAYVGHKGFRKTKNMVFTALQQEREYMESFENPWNAFTERVENIKETTMNFVLDEVSKGKIIYGMGASTKGNTLLQYFDLTPNEIIAIAEVNKEKYGLKTIGTNIPITPEPVALEAHPDYFFVLPWHFIDNFVDRNKNYLETGGKFIVPCPEPAIFTREGKTLL